MPKIAEGQVWEINSPERGAHNSVVVQFVLDGMVNAASLNFKDALPLFVPEEMFRKHYTLKS